MQWLKEFLAQAGTPVGTYSWGKVSADLGGKDGLTHAFIRYD